MVEWRDVFRLVFLSGALRDSHNTFSNVNNDFGDFLLLIRGKHFGGFEKENKLTGTLSVVLSVSKFLNWLINGTIPKLQCFLVCTSIIGVGIPS